MIISKHIIGQKVKFNDTGRINAEFSTVVSELIPLKARITATDKLIDQVVYKLYNLTQDEIDIVKGKGVS